MIKTKEEIVKNKAREYFKTNGEFDGDIILAKKEILEVMDEWGMQLDDNVRANYYEDKIDLLYRINETDNERIRELEKIISQFKRKRVNDILESCKNKIKYTKEDLEKAFNESRLMHPMIGFKYLSFNEYIESLNKN